MLFVADRLMDNKSTAGGGGDEQGAGHRRRAQHLKRTPPSPSDGSAPPAQDPERLYTCSAVLQRESSASTRGSLFQEGRASAHDGDATNPSDIGVLPLSASALDWVITH